MFKATAFENIGFHYNESFLSGNFTAVFFPHQRKTKPCCTEVQRFLHIRQVRFRKNQFQRLFSRIRTVIKLNTTTILTKKITFEISNIPLVKSL